MTQRSLYNNTNVSLNPFGTFTGLWETTTNFLELSAYVNSTAYLAVSIQQSQDASAVNINTTYNYTPSDEVTVFNTAVGLPFFRVILNNEANVQVAHMSLVSVLTAIPSATTAPTAVTIDGVVDVSGNVVATNLITETLATRRVDYLVVGNWYRVASVGITTGAEWQALSGGTACVGGQSVPDIGRLFKCVAVGPAVAGGGTVYDVEYTTDMSANVTGGVSITSPIDASGNVLVNDADVKYPWNSTAYPVEPQGLVGVKLMGLQAGDETWLKDGGYIPVEVNNFPATQAVSGTVSLTDPTSVRIRDAYGDPITTTAGNLMVGINNIYTANPLHTIVDSGPATQAVTGTFFQATQPVSIASSVAVTGTFFQAIQPVSLPTASAINYLSASNTGQTIKGSSGNLLSLFIQSDGNSGTNYVKIYNVAVPTASDTPVIVLASIHGTFQNVDCWNVGFSTAIGLRVTAGSSNADNTPPSNTINVNAFYV